jgi:L-iditol 2-dehydrogenase
MLAAVMFAVNTLTLENIPTPAAGIGEVLVRVGANTICGTDLRILRGEKRSHVQLPVVLGHECAGEVVDLGQGVTGYHIGDRVALLPSISDGKCWACLQGLENLCAHPNRRILGYSVNGALAEYILVPADAVNNGNLFVVADPDISYEQLALTEPTAAVINGHHQTRVGVGDSVLIMGAGPIGLLHLQLAVRSGARTVIVSQRSPARRTLAERLGATTTVDPTSEDLAGVVSHLTAGRGVDVTIICIGVADLVNQALMLTRPGGLVNIFAGLAGDGWATLQANLIHYKQLILTGASDIRRIDFQTALDLIVSGRIDTASLITHRFPLADVGAAIEAASGRHAIKVAVLPNA